MQRTNRYLILFTVLLLTACQELPRYFSGEKLLAKVGDKELVVDELVRAIPTEEPALLPQWPSGPFPAY